MEADLWLRGGDEEYGFREHTRPRNSRRSPESPEKWRDDDKKRGGRLVSQTAQDLPMKIEGDRVILERSRAAQINARSFYYPVPCVEAPWSPNYY